MSIFIDLTTFCETVEHELLIQQAKILGFPQVVLNIALQIYRGERLISSEGRVSHPLWASRGIMAGCPIAPALAKLALFPTCQKVYQSNQIQSMDVWLDDISVDVEHREPQAAARQALAVFRTLQSEQEQLSCSSASGSPLLYALMGLRKIAFRLRIIFSTVN